MEPRTLTIGGVVTSFPQRCLDCIEARERAAAEHREKERRELRWAWWQLHCPIEYRHPTPDGSNKFEIDRLPEVGQALYRRIMAWEYGPRGLLVAGETDLGKTRSLFQLCWRLLWEGRKVFAISANKFALECGRRFREGEEPERWINDMVAADVFFFNDMGKGKLTERSEAELFGVIARRCELHKPILMDVNFRNERAMKEAMTDDRGEPFVRRMFEFCTQLTVTTSGKLIEK